MTERQVSIWERLEQAAQAPRTALSHQAIAAAAVELADAEGLDAVSIRKLAARLSVAPMAIYRYVTSKEEILELMVDAVSAPPDDRLPKDAEWRDVMRATALGSRAVMLRHPWLGRAASHTLTGLTPNRMAGAERALSALSGLGLGVEDMMGILDTVLDYAQGATSREVVTRNLMAERGYATGDDLRGAYAPHMSWLMGTGRYPSFQAWALAAGNKDDFDGRFAFGLECVLDGIAARLGL